MKLVTESDGVITNPGEGDIENALKSLGQEGNNFVILDTEKEGSDVYLQVGGMPGAYLVEYRENDRQLRCGNAELPVGSVISLFKAFLKGDGSWKNDVPWEDITDEIKKGSGCLGIVLIIVAIVSMIGRGLLRSH